MGGGGGRGGGGWEGIGQYVAYYGVPDAQSGEILDITFRENVFAKHYLDGRI